MPGKLITLAEFLLRALHAPFKKKPKDGGRESDRFFETIGAEMGRARDRVLQAGRMMHPATAEEEYLDHWGRCLDGLYRIPGESDVDYSARLAEAFDFWREAGAGSHLVDWLGKIGWTGAVALHATRWAVRVLTLTGWSGLTGIDQLLADVHKWRPGHYLIEFAPSAPLAYAGEDYEYAHGTDEDTRPGLDHFLEFA